MVDTHALPTTVNPIFNLGVVVGRDVHAIHMPLALPGIKEEGKTGRLLRSMLLNSNPNIPAMIDVLLVLDRKRSAT